MTRHGAFSAETLAQLAEANAAVNPFMLEDGVMRELTAHPFRGAFAEALAEGVDWPWLKHEIAEFAATRKQESVRRDGANQSTAAIFHVGKPTRGLLPEEMNAMFPRAVFTMPGPNGELWVGFRAGSWSSAVASNLVMTELESKVRFTPPPGTVLASYAKGADGNVRVLVYRRDKTARQEFIEVFDPKSGKLLSQINLDDHAGFAQPVGTAAERTRPIGHFGYMLPGLVVGKDGTERLFATWKDATSNAFEPTLAATLVDLKTGHETKVAIPKGTYREARSRDAQEMFVYGWEGKQDTPRHLVVRSLVEGKTLLDVPFTKVPGRLHELISLFESSSGDLYVAARENRDGKMGVHFYDITHKVDRYLPLDNCDEGWPGFSEAQDHKISFVLPPTATGFQVVHPFDGGRVDLIPLSHDLSEAEVKIHRTPLGKPFLVAQTWMHQDPVAPNHIYLYDLEGHTGNDFNIGDAAGLRGLVAVLPTPEGYVNGLFTHGGRTDKHFSLATVPLYGPIEPK